ncbi:MAG TPA: TRAP transporter small permease [Burkholderiales bacterium]|nr:TRAP transporter small permease [Burkholderiales bacterium]
MRFAWFHRLEEGLIAFLLAVMTLVTFTQVIARYVFNYSFVWALELVTYLFGLLIFIGMSYGVRVGSHIGVDALVKALKPRAARVAGAAAALLCLVYALIMLYGSWQYVAKMYEIGIMAEDLPIPQWVPRLSLLLGFGLLVVRFGEAFFRIATGRETRLQVADEAVDALKHKEDFRT